MLKRFLTVLLGILVPTFLFAQYNYKWNEEKLDLVSPVKLQCTSYSSGLQLEGEEMKIELSKLGGMEGLSGLQGSLDSYGSSFNFSTSGKAKAESGHRNLAGARLDAKKDGQSVILCMFSTTDYKKHFICEAYFPENKRATIEAVIKSISLNTGGNNVINNNDVVVVKTDDIPVVNEDNNQKTGLTKGNAAPDFSLPDLNEKTRSLSSFRGKNVLLDFWGTWCGPCIKLIPKLKEIYGKYGGANFELISIANDVEVQKWKNMVAAKGMNWTNVIDQTEKVVKQYDIKAFPTLILINKKGIIESVGAGEDEIEEFLKGTTGENVNNNNNNNNDDNNNIRNDDNNNNNNNNDINNNFNNTNKNKIKVTNTHLSGNSIEKMTWKLLSTYSPDGYIVLDEYVNAPSEYDGRSQSGDSDFTKWIDGTSEKDVIKSINTVVHEMNHGYTGKLYLKVLKDTGKPVDGDYSAFYLGNREMKLVKHTEVYTTNEINSIFPKKLITGRYETYVYPSEKIMGSQQHGIYGLMDELNAYYIGTKAGMDFYDYYKEKADTKEGWSDYLTDFHGTYYAYLEFKSYMLIYMLYARENHQSVYNGILNNKDFKDTFRRIDDNWTSLIVEFNKVKKTVIANLRAKGIDVKEKDGYIMMDGSGGGNFAATYNTFQEELKNAKYEAIAKALGLRSASGPDFSSEN